MNYNQSFVSRITSTLTQIEHIESVEEVTTDIESLLAKAEELRKMQFSYNAEMTVLENDIYVNQHKLHVVEHNLIETKKDIEFAMTQEDELVCPICGTIYSNGLEEQLNITSDCKGDFNPNHRLKNSRIHNRIRHIHKDYLYLSRICSKDNSFRLVLRAKALLNL